MIVHASELFVSSDTQGELILVKKEKERLLRSLRELQSGQGIQIKVRVPPANRIYTGYPVFYIKAFKERVLRTPVQLGK